MQSNRFERKCYGISSNRKIQRQSFENRTSMSSKKCVKKDKSPRPNVAKKSVKPAEKRPAVTQASLTEKKFKKTREKLPEKPEEFADLIHDILRNKFEMCTFGDLMDYLNERYEPPVDTKIIRKIITDEFRKGCLAIRPVK